MREYQADLAVDLHSDALSNKSIDIVVSGSIGAVETPRFVRALRRLGAKVQVFLTRGGEQFTTRTALEWASANKIITEFSGLSAHISQSDACVIAPCSANMLSGINAGRTDTPSLALVQSYLGMKKTVLILPNMHDSLLHAPAVQNNINELRKYAIVMDAREEEGKAKFPAPKVLADHCAHAINKAASDLNVVVAMGSTKGFIDDVRFVTNYSSGGLGTAISTEFYRHGISTEVVCGPCQTIPQAYNKITHIETNEELFDATQNALAQPASGLIFAPSVLDFVPKNKMSGKLRSKDHDRLSVEFTKTKKLLALLNPSVPFKVGFKLEPSITEESAKAIAENYCQRYNLSHIVINGLDRVSASKHHAFIYSSTNSAIKLVGEQGSKVAIARALLSEIISTNI